MIKKALQNARPNTAKNRIIQNKMRYLQAIFQRRISCKLQYYRSELAWYYLKNAKYRPPAAKILASVTLVQQNRHLPQMM